VVKAKAMVREGGWGVTKKNKPELSGINIIQRRERPWTEERVRVGQSPQATLPDKAKI